MLILTSKFNIKKSSQPKQLQSMNGGRLLGSIVKLLRHTPVLTDQSMPLPSGPCHFGMNGTVSSMHSVGMAMYTGRVSALAHTYNSPNFEDAFGASIPCLVTRFSAGMHGIAWAPVRFALSMTRIKAKSMGFSSQS